jgi:hypothetical protein
MNTFHPTTPKTCPPKDATHPDGVFYRFVFNDPPIAEDFVIWSQEPEHPCGSKEKNCTKFAMSIFKTREGAARKFNIFEHALREKAKNRNKKFLGCAKITLTPECGLHKQTGSDPYHYDLWPYTDSRLERNVISVEGI